MTILSSSVEVILISTERVAVTTELVMSIGIARRCSGEEMGSD